MITHMLKKKNKNRYNYQSTHYHSFKNKKTGICRSFHINQKFLFDNQFAVIDSFRRADTDDIDSFRNVNIKFFRAVTFTLISR